MLKRSLSLQASLLMASVIPASLGPETNSDVIIRTAHIEPGAGPSGRWVVVTAETIREHWGIEPLPDASLPDRFTDNAPYHAHNHVARRSTTPFVADRRRLRP